MEGKSQLLCQHSAHQPPHLAHHPQLCPEHRLHPHRRKEKRSVCSRLGWAGCQNHNSACMVQTEAQRGSTPAQSYPVSEGASWGSLPGHPFIHIPGTAATHPECQSHRGVGVLDATWASGIRGIGYCPWLPALPHFHPCFLLMTLSFPHPESCSTYQPAEAAGLLPPQGLCTCCCLCWGIGRALPETLDGRLWAP